MAKDMMSSRTLSLKINEVLNHVGVNDEIIKYRRNCFLQMECIYKVYGRTCVERRLNLHVLYFGSQSEGTTSIGLNSDLDFIFIVNNFVVITSTKDDYVSKDTYTLHMDKFTNRGYCCLRDTSFSKNSKMSKLWSHCLKIHHKRNTSFLKNSFQFMVDFCGDNTEREGPARYYQSIYGEHYNFLHGICCTSWPREVSNTFILNQEKLFWPSDELLQDVLQSRCFVVPKGSDNGPDSDIEWRLSFSFGERLLMFDLNIVQIRCYVLMKYVKTSFLDNVQGCKGIVSSYICKTVLFHTVSQTRESEWVEEEILVNFNKCLCTLQKFIDEENCPHFIMPNNNLLANKLNESTRSRLTEILRWIIASNGFALFHIKIDEFGELLRGKGIKYQLKHEEGIRIYLLTKMIAELGGLKREHMLYFRQVQSIQGHTEMDVNNTERYYDTHNRIVCQEIKLNINKLWRLYHRTSEEMMHKAIRVLAGIYSTLIGSVQASADIKERHELSDAAFQWMLVGMKSTDGASAHLKLASILFAIENYDSTIILLDGIRKIIDGESVIHTCSCIGMGSAMWSYSSPILIKKSVIEIMLENIAHCVMYLHEEINSCPRELQYEMFRTAFDKKPEGNYLLIDWIYCATIPQLPFLYFMEYKLFKKLGMRTESRKALNHLKSVPCNLNFPANHLNTIYNLMGQCMEQEGDFDSALHCYYKSLKVEPVYNAAKILICCNIVKQLHKRT
ncbi:hypothetical protein ACF0H5_022409 [Mactra antiquata]